MTVHERVRLVFADVFDDPGFQLHDDMTAANVAGWDSLNHINLVVGIESEFDVQFDAEEVAALSRVGDLFDLLARHGAIDA
jgi:acyl carrier protein